MRALHDDIHKSHAERTSGLQTLFESTDQLLQQFDSDHERIAIEQGNQLRGFVSGLQDTVAATRKEFQADNAEAQAAWLGSK
jgi:hypothetical protein